MDAPADDMLYACGLDTLMIVLPGQKLIQRWSLRTFQREKTAPVPGDQPVLTALMGGSSRGPLVLWAGANVMLYDVDRMEEIQPEGKVLSGGKTWGFELRASADGRAFIGWTPGLSPSGYVLMRLEGKRLTLCWPLGGGGQRPTHFDSKGGRDWVVLTLQRE